MIYYIIIYYMIYYREINGQLDDRQMIGNRELDRLVKDR